MSTLILGGGLGGLSAAHYFLKSFKDPVTLVEASKRLGGWVNTVEDAKTGTLFEKGPRTIRPRGEPGANTLELIEDLGLTDKVIPIPSSHPSAKSRFIYTNNQLHKLPSSLASVFTKQPPLSKPLIAAMFKDLFAKKKTCADDSIYNFVSRRFGNDIAEFLISPMICGICAGDAKEISVKFLVPSWFEKEQQHGSVLRGLWKDKSLFSAKEAEGALSKRAKNERWSVWGLRGGLEQLPLALENELANKCQIIKDTPIDSISFKDGHVTCLINGSTQRFDRVISSVPSNILSKLVQSEHPVLSDHLSSIPYVSVVVLNLVYNKPVLKQEAFGFLVPPREKLPILGVIFDSCSFPQNGKTVLTAMMGGKWFKEYSFDKLPDEGILDLCLFEINKILNIKESPESYHLSVLKDCIPQYVIGHHDRIQKITGYIKEKQLPLSLVGSSYYGVGINDVILSARNAVDELKV